MSYIYIYYNYYYYLLIYILHTNQICLLIRFLFIFCDTHSDAPGQIPNQVEVEMIVEQAAEVVAEVAAAGGQAGAAPKLVDASKSNLDNFLAASKLHNQQKATVNAKCATTCQRQCKASECPCKLAGMSCTVSCHDRRVCF